MTEKDNTVSIRIGSIRTPRGYLSDVRCSLTMPINSLPAVVRTGCAVCPFSRAKTANDGACHEDHSISHEVIPPILSNPAIGKINEPIITCLEAL